MDATPAPSEIPVSNPLPDPLLTAGEVAAILKINKATAYRLMQTGEIPSIRIRRSVRTAPADLAEFISAHRATP